MIKEKFKVRFYSDSLGLPRGNEILQEQRYISIICNFLREKHNGEIEILDRSRANYNINDLYQWFIEDNKYFQEKCDIIIIQEGVVDCAPRPIPRKIRNIVSRMPNFLKQKIIRFLHNNRAKLQNIGLKYYYVKPKEYYKRYGEFLSEAAKNADRVYIFNIAPTNVKTERQSPGFSSSIQEYNHIIKDVLNQLELNNIHLLDVYSYIKERENEIDTYVNVDDGHHITIEGHKLFASVMISKENTFSTYE